MEVGNAFAILNLVDFRGAFVMHVVLQYGCECVWKCVCLSYILFYQRCVSYLLNFQ